MQVVEQQKYVNLKPVLKAREIDLAVRETAIALGLHPVIARIIAARPMPEDVSLTQLLNPKLRDLIAPFSLTDLTKAAARIVTAINNSEIIAIVTDHDCDGQTAHAVIKTALMHHFKVPQNRILSFIGHRLEEGYGLSNKLVQRMLQSPLTPNLVITADHGSADEPRIAMLAAEGIDVIVTDHHHIPVIGVPQSAFACINPLRQDSTYPDLCIAGCMVAWLLMVAVRKELLTLEPGINLASMQDLLDFVAVGTIADCVSMARSLNNRIVVHYGLRLINAGVRPCWQALKDLCVGQITAKDLGFVVGPLLNSDGRLSDALGSLDLLMAPDLPTARVTLRELQEQNVKRKDMQDKIVKRGIELATKNLKIQHYSLVLYLSDGHSGVHGIAASRLKDLYGRPTVFLAPKHQEANIVTGSIRGINNFNVNTALQYIHQQDPNLMLSFGGHVAAGGVSFALHNLKKFTELFEQAAKQQLLGKKLGPELIHDGVVDLKFITLDFLEELQQLEPFGREFEEPTFIVLAELVDLRLLRAGAHAKIVLQDKTHKVTGIWFNCNLTEDFMARFSVNQKVECAFVPTLNIYQGLKSAQLQIKWLEFV